MATTGSALNNKKAIYIFLSSIACSAFWLVANLVPVYAIAWIGALFEILWLPMLALTFIVPVLCVVFMIKEKKYFTSYYFFSLLVIGITIFILTTFGSKAS
jgi:hypothetical protein